MTKSVHTYGAGAESGANAPFDIPTDLLIGDAWREGASGRRFDVVNPSNGEVLTSVADADVGDGLAAVAAAHAASSAWAATAPRLRAKTLQVCFEKMIEHLDWLAELISLENGKSLADAKSEVVYAAEFFRWYAEEAVRINGELAIAPGGANRIMVQYQPIGISLLITPWNFPAAMATRKMAPSPGGGLHLHPKARGGDAAHRARGRPHHVRGGRPGRGGEPSQHQRSRPFGERHPA